MVLIINQVLNKKHAILFAFVFFVAFLLGCSCNIVDNNVEVPNRKWTYRNHLKVAFEIRDSKKPYNIYFKLRHTADYRYANIFILVHFKDGKNKVTKRYQYKLAKNDGEWLGNGSGNVFNYTFPLLTSYHFAHKGRFEIEIEQNMRDNPLLEVSDIGVLIK